MYTNYSYVIAFGLRKPGVRNFRRNDENVRVPQTEPVRRFTNPKSFTFGSRKL